MDNEPGILRIGIPTGFGTNGVRKEALAIAKQMLSTMTPEPIHQQWCKYYTAEPDPDYYTYYKDTRWGMVLTVKVDNLRRCKAIMLDFDYDNVIELDSERLKETVELQSYFKGHLMLKKRNF